MQIPFIIKDKNLKFFIGTGNLRTRGYLKHPGPAQAPMVPGVCCGPALGATQTSPPVSPSSLGLSTSAGCGSFLGTATAWRWKKQAQQSQLPRGGLSSREDGSRSQEDQGAHPGPLASLPAPGHPSHLLSTAPVAPRPGPASRGPTAGPVEAPPPALWSSSGSPGLASPWGRPLDPLSALRSSAVPPQQGPEEKLRLREAETSSRSHRCIWSGREQGPLY